jgi:hypothetical protein
MTLDISSIYCYQTVFGLPLPVQCLPPEASTGPMSFVHRSIIGTGTMLQTQSNLWLQGYRGLMGSLVSWGHLGGGIRLTQGTLSAKKLFLLRKLAREPWFPRSLFAAVALIPKVTVVLRQEGTVFLSLLCDTIHRWLAWIGAIELKDDCRSRESESRMLSVPKKVEFGGLGGD